MTPSALRLATFLLVAVVAACSSGGAATSAPTAAATAAPTAATAIPATAGPTAPSATAGPSATTATQPAATGSPIAASATATAATLPPTSAPQPTASAAPSAGGPSATSAAGQPTWTKIAVEGGPAPREDHTWTIDGEGRYAYLFGGRDGTTVFDDLWRFDLEQERWERVDAANAPPARFGHTATLVPDYGLVIFGGQAAGGFFNDLWVYDGGTSWQELPSGGARPEPRYGTCAGLAPDGRLWISHGFTDQGRFFDQRAYDFASGTWADVSRDDPVPVIRCLHDCVWTSDGRFVLYGGQTNGVAALGDLWSRTADGQWRQEGQPPLQARQLYAVTVAGDSAWIFGGADIDHRALGDLWTLDLATFEWARVTPAGADPPARLSATLVTDSKHNRLLLFGGKNSSTTFGDLWSLALPS
jgi:hypothetical protein